MTLFWTEFLRVAGKWLQISVAEIEKNNAKSAALSGAQRKWRNCDLATGCQGWNGRRSVQKKLTNRHEKMVLQA